MKKEEKGGIQEEYGKEEGVREETWATLKDQMPPKGPSLSSHSGRKFDPVPRDSLRWSCRTSCRGKEVRIPWVSREDTVS